MAVIVNNSHDVSGVIDSEEELRKVAEILGKEVFDSNRMLPDEPPLWHIHTAESMRVELPGGGHTWLNHTFGIGDWVWIHNRNDEEPIVRGYASGDRLMGVEDSGEAPDPETT